ncbi:MAG: hypothetical protein HQ582_08135, partial [Planctomycetes bacterium]|nr:hypothetical protein [Planctomycetota bacterium]
QGTYDENLSISTNDITLQGNTETATDVVIDPDGSGVGITVTSNDVTIRHLRVTDAGDDGIAVDGVNNFTALNVQSDLNVGDGFDIGDGALFAGTITLTDVTADNNLQDGASIKGGGAGTVAVSGGSYSGNSSHGIGIENVGPVTTTNVMAADNDPGVFINGAASYTDIGGDFSGNDDHGIQLIDIADNVTLTLTTANDNDADNDGIGDGLNATDGGDGDGLAIGGNLVVWGAAFRDTDADGGVSHQERGVSVADGVGDNVTFEDSGAIEVTVDGNDSHGVSIQGANNGAFTNGAYEFNGGDGLLLDAFNDLFFTDVSAANNGDDGLDVNSAAAVTINGGTFNDNSSDGIELLNVAAVDVTGGAVASDNGGDGANVATFTTAALALLTTSSNNTGVEISGGTTLNVQDWTALGNTTIGGDLDSIVEVNFTTTTGTAETADQVDVYETQFRHVRAGDGQDLVDYDNIGTLNLDTGDGRDVFTLFTGVNNLANAGDINLDGGQPSAGPSIGPGDRLVMADGGTATFTDPTTGTGLADPPGGAGPIYFTDIEEFLAEDDFEFNDTPATATILGSLPKITLRDLTIHDPDDVDYFKYTAPDTGKLIVNMFLDHAAGDLDLSVQDAHGNVLGAGVLSNIIVPGLDMEHLVIPVVSQEAYWIEVVGVAGDTNEYDLEIENFAAPAPDFVDLPAKDQSHLLNDTGTSVYDDVTSRTEPEIIIEADLDDFVQEGIDVLSASDAEAGLTAGAAVEVFVNGNSAGFADLVAGPGTRCFATRSRRDNSPPRSSPPIATAGSTT